MNKWNISQVPSQAGKVAIVTGANNGLGYETALGLAKKNVEVVLACRNLQKAEEAQNRITHPGLSKTNLDQYFPALIRPLGNLFLQPAKKGALPVLYAALEKDINGGEFIGPDGFQEMRGYPTRVDSDKYSKDKKVAEHLWKASEEMTNSCRLP